MGTAPTIYLAGPTVFLKDAAAQFRILKAACAAWGFHGVSPVDGDEALADFPTKAALAEAIRTGNVAKIRACDLMLADVTPFRGPGADDGTAWEMGFAEALGKTVIPYSTDAERTYIEQVADMAGWCGTSLEYFGRDADGVTRDPNGVQVEDFGLPANLMLAAGALPIQPSFEVALDCAAAFYRLPRTTRGSMFIEASWTYKQDGELSEATLEWVRAVKAGLPEVADWSDASVFNAAITFWDAVYAVTGGSHQSVMSNTFLGYLYGIQTGTISEADNEGGNARDAAERLGQEHPWTAVDTSMR